MHKSVLIFGMTVFDFILCAILKMMEKVKYTSLFLLAGSHRYLIYESRIFCHWLPIVIFIVDNRMTNDIFFYLVRDICVFTVNILLLLLWYTFLRDYNF